MATGQHSDFHLIIIPVGPFALKDSLVFLGQKTDDMTGMGAGRVASYGFKEDRPDSLHIVNPISEVTDVHS